MRLCSLLAVLAGLAPATEAPAQSYPTRAVEIVVPFVPGGGTDLIARATADYLGKRWGQPLLVVNKPGGGGVIGARYALKEARPDGYTVLMDIHTTAPMMIGAWKTPPLTLADRKWAGRIVLDPMVFAVKADAPWKDFKEFSEWVKAHPEQLVWSSVGPAGPSRYTAFDWFTQIGVDPGKTKMVITDGAADSMTKLAGGHVMLAIHSVAEAKAMVEAGKIRLLAVLAPKRIRYIPDVPTAEEQGVMKGVSVSWWAGISLPAGAPDAIVKQWEAALAEMVKDPAFLAVTDRLWMNVDHLNAARMAAFVEEQAAYYTTMAGKIGLRK
ncbi:MAG TPA: tripartite tricarboxylate transporter substrate binding protein [Candidatus Binatia bacterium]|nr:tripartite tricarboxylate transporter substrate binding protein [Candidatus Binatia bacterium]